MRTTYWSALLFAGLIIIGCGGGGSVFTDPPPLQTATVTGRVLDDLDRPIRDARVTASTGEQTFTSPTGAFKLENVTVGEIDIVADIVSNGITYRGGTFVLTFDGEQRSSAVIVVAPTSQLGRIQGTVRDRDGFTVDNAPVYAYSGAGNSARAYTNSSGNYVIEDLVGGTSYEVLSMSRGYRGDRTTVQVQAGATRNANFVLDDPGTPNLTAPQNLQAVTWVSPRVATRAPGKADPYDAIKAMLSPNRTKAMKRASVHKSNSKAITDILVEAELFWDEQRFDDHLGWGIYFAGSANGQLSALEYFSDPLTAYFFDQGVSPNFTVSYAVTTLSSVYPEFPNVTESALSNRVVVDTLDVLELANPTFNPLTFRWLTGSGADEFVVYLFDEYPDVEVDSFWNSANAPTNGNFKVYDGPGLQAGQTYYYIVLGLSTDQSARTISQIGSFTL